MCDLISGNLQNISLPPTFWRNQKNLKKCHQMKTGKIKKKKTFNQKITVINTTKSDIQ